MSTLDISRQNLTQLEIGGDTLIAYSENGEPKRFSLVGVTSLNCSHNRLSVLPLLPRKLEILDCSNNQLPSLPLLPERLKKLFCCNNQLTSLSLLPRELKVLGCYNNQLTSLSLEAGGLERLNCSYNQLTSLHLLPERLKELFCYNNQLTSLSLLPRGLNVLGCYNNPLKYVPFFKERPRYLNVPKFLRFCHSIENYQEGYRLQETNRYLFLMLFTELDLQIDFLA